MDKEKAKMDKNNCPFSNDFIKERDNKTDWIRWDSIKNLFYKNLEILVTFYRRRAGYIIMKVL